MNVPKKAGDIPAWVQALVGVLVIVFAAGGAWTAASTKLKGVDAMKEQITVIEKAVCAMAIVQATKANDQDSRLLEPATDLCKRR